MSTLFDIDTQSEVKKMKSVKAEYLGEMRFLNGQWEV